MAATPQKNVNAMFSVLNTLHISELQYWLDKISTSSQAAAAAGKIQINENVEMSESRWEPQGA